MSAKDVISSRGGHHLRSSRRHRSLPPKAAIPARGGGDPGLTWADGCTPQEIRVAQFPVELADADPIEEPHVRRMSARPPDFAYDPAAMALSHCSTLVRTVLRLAGDLVRLVAAAVRSHPQLAAENLFLRKQLALYVERQVKPRRADNATRIALVALSWLIDWRRLLTVVKPDTLVRWHRQGFRLF